MTENNNDGRDASITDDKRKPGWERDLLERLAFASLAEQRRSRRWSIFFRFFYAVLLLPLILALLSSLVATVGALTVASRYTAVVELDGEISTDSLASADNVIAGLRDAFEGPGTAGVVIRANSPGGSPVQAGYIYDEIKRLRAKYPNIRVYGVVTDMCASGCYYALAATDKIYADRASVVGSIGVLMNGFGFVDAMKKVGVERRLMTAGEHKGILDPFSPIDARERKHVQAILNNVHQQFIERVREGRGQQLKETKEIFSGLFWTGEEALKLGLVDEFGSTSFVAREVIGAEDIIDFTRHEGVVDRFARRLGGAMTKSLSSEILGSRPALR